MMSKVGWTRGVFPQKSDARKGYMESWVQSANPDAKERKYRQTVADRLVHPSFTPRKSEGRQRMHK
jgi:hypothetical protein